MPIKKRGRNKKSKQTNFAKLSIFQHNKSKFKKSCPLSLKGAPVVDYKNINLLKKYTSENGKIIDELEKNEVIDKNLLRYMTVKVKKFDLEAKYFSKKEESETKEYKKD